ncbi:cytochrome P450 [Mycolicibacterium iranicum]|uniref:Cytochrome P450 n=1 Tax=Mycolicibacterium iranicum TaxID=912594 RepID=A0A839QDE6_MYCIR|nr:cytochrome P450 [Mycolicibacterium iranicum]MBB2993627.1 cytochrome P450 [Mycolicibacterium iranicum]
MTSDLRPLPKSPLSYRKRIAALQDIHTGCEIFRDAGGPVTEVEIAPRWMLPPFVVVTSPQGARDVLTATFPTVDRNFPFMTEQQQLNGGSLLNFAHRDWVGRRRMLQPVFTRQQISRLSETMFRIALDCVSGWGENGTVDLDRDSRRITMRVLGRSIMAFEPDRDTDELVEPMRRISAYIAARGRAPVKLPRWVPTPARRHAVAFNRLAHDLAAEILLACRQDPDRDAPLVRAMLDTTDPETGEPLSDEDICHELVIFLASGLETTATTLAYALWALGRHPEIQERVAAEVRDLDDASLTSDPRACLPYTMCVLQEALRLGGPTPAIMRVARTDMEVDGHRIPSGSQLVVGVYALHRDPQLWADPLTFDPERFTAQNSRGHDRWQFLPFGGGPRSCIGEHFALTAAALELAAVMRTIEIGSTTETFPISAPLTIVPDGPIPAKVSHRA